MKNLEEKYFLRMFESYIVDIIADQFTEQFIILNLEGNNLLIVSYEDDCIDINYKYIWKPFEKEFNMNFDDVKYFLQKMIIKHFNVVVSMIIPFGSDIDFEKN